MHEPVSIETVRRLAKRHGVTSMVVFYVTDLGLRGYTSYGNNRKRCRRTAEMADKMLDTADEWLERNGAP